MSSLFIPHGKISPSLSLVPDLTQTTRHRCSQGCQVWPMMTRQLWCGARRQNPACSSTARLTGHRWHCLRQAKAFFQANGSHRFSPQASCKWPSSAHVYGILHLQACSVLVIFPRKGSYLMRGLGTHVQKSTNQKLQLIKSTLKKFPSDPVQPTVSKAMFLLELAPQSKRLGYPMPETLAENKEVTN